MRRLLISMWLLVLAGLAMAQAVRPFVHPLFSDHAILQRGPAAPVWGWTTPGAKVTVQLGTVKAEAIAAADGKWLATLGPLEAGGPYTLQIDGPQRVTLQNVLVGDVWLCSGQSNMQMGVSGVRNAQAEIDGADFPNIRLFTVPNRPAFTPQALVAGAWSPCTPASVKHFSATAFFFGRMLHQDLKVPIGLLHSSWGGTICEAWTSAGALRAMPDFQKALDELPGDSGDICAPEEFPARLQAWLTANDPEPTPARSTPACDDAKWATQALPTAWANTPLGDFRGTLWLRRAFEAPEEADGVDLTLHLGTISGHATVWLNGTKLGEKDNTKTAAELAVPGKLVKAGRNVLVIRIIAMAAGGGFLSKANHLSVEFAAPDLAPIPLEGPWRLQVGVDARKVPGLPRKAEMNPNRVSVLYNGMIAPLLPFAIKGAIWYQGESNVGRGKQYQTLLPTMIADWRARFGVGDFPFYIVQIANFLESKDTPTDSAWAELREAQALTAQRVPHTGLACLIDIGEARDIHPRNKQDVGRRLALNAEALAYGLKVAYSGPTFKALTIDGNRARLTFDHTDGGLTVKGDTLTGFAVAGADGTFVWADAVIDGDAVVVSAKGVPHPAAVRYAWADNPACNLYNGAGLPAVPFRTDGK
jgi:sialate O-acetylesterase